MLKKTEEVWHFPIVFINSSAAGSCPESPLLTLLTWLHFFKETVKWLCLFEQLNFVGWQRQNSLQWHNFQLVFQQPAPGSRDSQQWLPRVISGYLESSVATCHRQCECSEISYQGHSHPLVCRDNWGVVCGTSTCAILLSIRGLHSPGVQLCSASFI